MTVTGKTKYDANNPYNKNYVAPNSSFATKTDTPIMETPLNIQVLPKAVLDDQQATRLDQAVKLVSGVTTGQGAGGISDQITIRGFFNYNYFRNGMRIDTNGGSDGTRAMANVQSIEVLKGPAAMLYGRVEPGGMVNVVTKKPLDTPYYALQQQFGSFDFYRTSIDATGPVADNKDLLYRMNVSYENSTIGAKPDRLPLSIGDGILAETADAVVSVPEIFNYWLQPGLIAVGFLGVAQIDKFGNINTTVIGADYAPALGPAARRRRRPGDPPRHAAR